MHAHQTTYYQLSACELRDPPEIPKPWPGYDVPPSPLSQTLPGAPHTLGYLKTKPQERLKVFYVFGVFLHCTESVSHD